MAEERSIHAAALQRGIGVPKASGKKTPKINQARWRDILRVGLWEQAYGEHTATDGKTTAKDLNKSKKNMNDKERTRSNTDSNGGNDWDMKKTKDMGMHATKIQNSNHRRKTECDDLNKTIIEVEDITEDSFFADIITNNKNKRKRLYSSSPEEGVEKYRKTGMDISTEKIIEQFEKLEKFCEQNKNVHKPIKESVGMMRFTINRLSKGMEN
ncbi:hypothetical protein WA026_022236 [Henosepilachna vigintioctopunctata]|uniref:Uncharacterized protein n=1 Tax=Henosepilachna vigintioctopunctata TaxID=420089 RepID=A0AAW1UQE0_9CUCU